MPSSRVLSVLHIFFLRCRGSDRQLPHYASSYARLYKYARCMALRNTPPSLMTNWRQPMTLSPPSFTVSLHLHRRTLLNSALSLFIPRCIISNTPFVACVCLCSWLPSCEARGRERRPHHHPVYSRSCRCCTLHSLYVDCMNRRSPFLRSHEMRKFWILILRHARNTRRCKYVVLLFLYAPASVTHVLGMPSAFIHPNQQSVRAPLSETLVLQSRLAPL